MPSTRVQQDANMSAVLAKPVVGATHAVLPSPEPLSEDLLRRFDTPGPRYTSYPTADRFAEAFGPEHAVEALCACARVPEQPLSVYVHIPFCESLCYYCACNKIITRHHERAAEYIEKLE